MSATRRRLWFAGGVPFFGMSATAPNYSMATNRMTSLGGQTPTYDANAL